MDKRTLILESALKLFVEQGFHGTPTSKIAKEARVANGTLFHHFKTKEDLIIALYLDIKANIKHPEIEDFKNGGSFKSFFKTLFLNQVYGMIEEPAKSKYILQFKASPYFTKLKEQNLDDGSQAFIKVFEDAAERGDIKPHDIHFVFILLSNLLIGLTQYLQSQEFSKTEEHKIIDSTFNMVWRMLT